MTKRPPTMSDMPPDPDPFAVAADGMPIPASPQGPCAAWQARLDAVAACIAIALPGKSFFLIAEAAPLRASLFSVGKIRSPFRGGLPAGALNALNDALVDQLERLAPPESPTGLRPDGLGWQVAQTILPVHSAHARLEVFRTMADLGADGPAFVARLTAIAETRAT